ncbi:hypothetical protein QJS66_09260 [Kocuria rhizophila]|nr:hypothetical protein QJS66_09260 [Kocuria rhizophila]
MSMFAAERHEEIARTVTRERRGERRGTGPPLRGDRRVIPRDLAAPVPRKAAARRPGSRVRGT